MTLLNNELSNYFENKRCIVCQSILKKMDLSDEKFSDETSIRMPVVIGYICALFGIAHYVLYLNETETKIEEEKLKFILNNKEYDIIQYWDNNDLVITVYDEEGKFEYSKCLTMPVLAFDFLNCNLDQAINRLKTILIFQ